MKKTKKVVITNPNYDPENAVHTLAEKIAQAKRLDRAARDAERMRRRQKWESSFLYRLLFHER